jgi:hypothetical protein
VGITEVPVVRTDGTVLTEPGYDSATRLYNSPAPALLLPPVPKKPAAEEIEAAVALVMEIFCDFPFDNKASRANAIAAYPV